MTKAITLRNAYAVTLADSMQMAEAFYKSGIFQDVEDEAQALVKVLKGAEIGLPAVTAMESIDILKIPATEKRKARVSLFIRAHACAALLRSCGYGDYQVTQSTKEACTVLFRKRTLAGWVDLPVITYTFELAKKNRLVREGSQWEIDPENMLYQRAMKRGVERYFPELVKGLQITEDLPEVTAEHAQQTIADLWGRQAAEEETVSMPPREIIDMPSSPLPTLGQDPASLQHFFATLSPLVHNIGLSPGALLPLVQRRFRVNVWAELPLEHATTLLEQLRTDPQGVRQAAQGIGQTPQTPKRKSASPPPTYSAPPDALSITEKARLQDLIQRAQRLVNQAHNAIQGEDLLAPHIVDLEAEIATGVSMVRDDTVSDDMLATCHAQIETLMQQGIVGSMQGEQG